MEGRAFEDVSHAQLACRLLYAMTNSHGSRAIAVVISSTMQSTKYSCAASPVMFSKGKTARDGLSESGSGAQIGSAARDDAPSATR